MNTLETGMNKATKFVRNALDGFNSTTEDRTDAISFLKSQHREVDELFSQLEDAGPQAFRSKEETLALLAAKLEEHALLEEKFFYPKAKSVDSDLVLEAAEEHAIVKEMLAKLSDLDASDETFDAKITVLKELVKHHVKEEEDELFPECEKSMSDEMLEKIGAEMCTADLTREFMEKTHGNGAAPRRAKSATPKQTRKPMRKAKSKAPTVSSARSRSH